jgi:hypothetical protein
MLDRARRQVNEGKLEGKLLLQLGVFRFRSYENRNVRVGILPKLGEILIRGLGLRGIALHRIAKGSEQSLSMVFFTFENFWNQ